MFESNKRLTADELQNLYPGIVLLEGYDSALMGVLAAPNDSFIPVYDTFALIDVISKKGFESKEELNAYFTKLVDSAKSGNLGPMFVQSVRLKTRSDNKDKYDDDGEEDTLFVDDDSSDSDSDSQSDWKDPDSNDFGMEDISGDSEYDYEDDDEEDPPFGYKYVDDDSDSDILSEHEEDNKEHYLEIEVHVTDHEPGECKVNNSVEDIKQAISLFFPKLSDLRIVKQIKFFIINAKDVNTDEDDLD